MIISGGVNIYPAEIEKEMLEHPAVSEVCVIGVPDEKWGEVPVAFVVKTAMDVDEASVLDYLRLRISKIKLPRHILFIDGLPRNAYGKVLKLELRERLADLRAGKKPEPPGPHS